MNKRGKSVDRTYLSIDQAEDRGFIHRDYIAHCLRWSHVCKKLYEHNTYRSAIILDVGCGRELPLAKLLYSSRLIPRHYFGIDVGPIEDSEAAKLTKTGKFPHDLWEEQNFLDLKFDEVLAPAMSTDDDEGEAPPNIVTCFEVLEHVEPKMMIQMLHHMQKLSSDDARFFISTPCWNRVDCAANHVNEMTYEALAHVFMRSGFCIKHVYGTFASIRDYEHLLSQNELHEISIPHRAVFERLREYYDSNFLSCIFAPLFPAQSRNCLWELVKNGEPDSGDPRFPESLEKCQEPWGSSELWRDMAWQPNE